MNWPLLQNSLLVSGLATLLALGFGLGAALWLGGLPGRWRHCFLALSIIALALPPFLVTNCWLDLLGQNGVLRRWLPLNIFSFAGAIWILALLLWPITLICVQAAWRRLEPAQLESDIAIAGWPLIRGLLVPLVGNALLLAGVLTFALALNNFAVPAILQIKVFPAEMWVRFNTTFDTRGTLRLSWPLIALPLLLPLLLTRRPIPWPHAEPSVSPGLFRRQVGAGWFWVCGAGTTTVLALAVGLPLVQLGSAKRTWTELPGALAADQSAVWNSVRFAAVAAAAVVVLGLAARRVKSGLRRSKRDRRPKPEGRFRFSAFGCRFSNLLWLLFLMPGVLLGLALITVFNRPWSSLFYQSAGIVILAFVLRYSALGWTTVSHATAAVDRDLADAARIEGASRLQLLRFVYWPQIGPQVAAAWYIVFLLCLWDVESMILIVPPGGETLALRIFNLLHYGHNAQVNALCLGLLAVAAAPMVIWKVAGVLWRVPCAAIRASLIAVPALLLAACSPASHSNVAALHSQLFSRVEVIGSRGVGLGQLNKPRSVAIDKRDNLYVVDMTARVQKFSPDGGFLLCWQLPQTDLGKPKGMCRGSEGDILVLEPHYQRVNRFSPGGQLIAQWGQRGTNGGQFTLPRAIAVNSRGEIFVSEYSTLERVQKFAGNPNSAGPRWLSSFGHAGTGPGEFNRPEGLCVDAQDRVYVADSCNHRIQVFSSDGQFLRAYGRAGSGKGELSYPYDICVDARGRQYVCEFGNSRIQVFDANDQPIEIIGGPGAEPGQFSNPWALALDRAGNLYVADAQNHRVQKLIRSPKSA